MPISGFYDWPRLEVYLYLFDQESFTAALHLGSTD